MDMQKIDSIVKKVIEESNDYYNGEAAKVKGKIWEHVQAKKLNRSNRMLVRLLAAACIVFFLTTVFLSFTLVRTKNSEKNLVALNNHLTGLLAEKNEKIFDQESKISLAQNNLKDTVYVVKKEMVYHPVEKIQRITDTVYVQRTVINEKVPAKESLVAEKNDNVSATTIDNAPTNYNTEILIRRNEPKNVKKKWRIRFRFGADRDQVDSKSFALTAEL